MASSFSPPGGRTAICPSPFSSTRPCLNLQCLLPWLHCHGGSYAFFCNWNFLEVCRAYNWMNEGPKQKSSSRARCSNRVASESSARDDGQHYRILGLSSRASPQDIKLAFRQLARQYHPDVNKDLGADEMFKSIRLAYEAQEARRNRLKHNNSGSYNGHRTRGSRGFQRSGNLYWRATDYEGVWDLRSADTTINYRSAFNRKRNGAFSEEILEESGTEYHHEKDFTLGDEAKMRGWDEDWQKKAGEIFFVFSLVALIWHALGAQIALTYFVFFMPHDEQHSAGYRLASVVAWLIGGKRGLALKFGIVTITWLFGKAYDNVMAIVLLALWVGGDLMRVIPLPRGAILFMTYLCIGKKLTFVRLRK